MKSLSRLLILSLFAFGVLPSSAVLKPVAYVEATGSQWINTHYLPSCTDQIEATFRLTTTNGAQTIWCSRGSATTTATMTTFLTAGRYRFDRNATISIYASDAAFVQTSADTTIVADYGTQAVTINGESAATMATGTFTTGAPLVLFASHFNYLSAPDNYAHVRLSAFKIRNAEGTLVRDYVPVVDASDAAKVGLFDTVTKTFCAGCGPNALVAGAVTSETVTYVEDPTAWTWCTAVSVPADETRSLTADEVTALGTKPLVKIGAGTLVAGSEMADFTGDIIIRDGCYKATNSAALGTSDGRTYVDGGTLWNTVAGYTDWTDAGGKTPFGQEVFVLRGSGYNNQGAVYQTQTGCSNLAGQGKILLEGNLRIGGSQTLEFRYGTVYQNSCSITVAMSSKDTAFRFVAGSFNDYGDLEVESGTLGFESGIGTVPSSRTITLHDGTCFKLNNVYSGSLSAAVDFGANCTIRIGASGSKTEPGSLTTVNRLYGPISIPKSIPVAFDAIARLLNISGTVSGAGGFSVTGGGYLQLDSPNNSFSGGVSVTGVTPAGSDDLTITGGVTVAGRTVAATSANGVIPVDGGPIAITNARLTLADDRLAALPDLVVAGKSVVSGLTAITTFKSLTKTGTGPLTIFGPAKILGATDFGGGTVRFGTRATLEGLNWYYRYGTTGSHTLTGMSGLTYEGVSRAGATYAYNTWKSTSGSDGASSHNQCHTYKGYICVPGEEGDSVTCNFVSCICRNVSVVIDGKTYVVKVSDNKDDLTNRTLSYKRCVVCPQVTLSAGWHSILIYMGNYWNASAGPLTCDKPVWPAQFGIGVDWQGRCSSNTTDYVKLLDPGDGSFLRVGSDKAALDPTPYRPTFCGSVSFAPGTVLDINDVAPFTPVVIPELKGLPTIRNGAVTVTNTTWTLRASDFADVAATPLTVESGASLTFAPNTVAAFEGDFSNLPHQGTAKARRFLLMTGGTIANLPRMVGRVGASDWYVRPSSDGEGYELFYSKGTFLLFR